MLRKKRKKKNVYVGITANFQFWVFEISKDSYIFIFFLFNHIIWETTKQVVLTLYENINMLEEKVTSNFFIIKIK